jgi:hypothetical protein
VKTAESVEPPTIPAGFARIAKNADPNTELAQAKIQGLDLFRTYSEARKIKIV